MAELGIFGEDERLELVDGEIIPMSPKGARHQSTVRRTARQLRRVYGEADFTLMEDSALGMGDLRERYPDLLVATGGEAVYNDRVAEASDVVLVVEIADTTFKKDRDEKVPEYAAAGVPECWLMDVRRWRLFVYRDPDPVAGRYRQVDVLGEDGQVVAGPGQGTPVAVADLLPLC
jgi:Uma2 family endonuclease